MKKKDKKHDKAGYQEHIGSLKDLEQMELSGSVESNDSLEGSASDDEAVDEGLGDGNMQRSDRDPFRDK